MPAKKKTTKKAAAPKTKTKKQDGVAIPEMRIKKFQVDIEGTGEPIVVHAWSQKAIQEMLDKQLGKPKAGKKEPKNPVMDFADSLYWLDDRPDEKLKALDPEDYEGANKVAKGHRFGFPTIAFKKAMVSACRNIEGIPMTLARGAFHVVSDVIDPREGLSMVELMNNKGPAHPEIRRDMVRIGQGTADIRYRGEFRNWHARLTIEYNSGVMSPDQIINLLNIAGFAVGVGENRPEKDGSWGTFRVVGG